MIKYTGPTEEALLRRAVRAVIAGNASLEQVRKYAQWLRPGMPGYDDWREYDKAMVAAGLHTEQREFGHGERTAWIDSQGNQILWAN